MLFVISAFCAAVRFSLGSVRPDAPALTFAYPVAATEHRWQLKGKPRHQYQYDPSSRLGPDGFSS
jgi:hypothetical protein